MKTKLLSFIFGCCCSFYAAAFSDLGHKIVAAAAWEQLTPYAKQNIERILGVGPQVFINASVWADHIKSNKKFDYLKPLHYVNLPKEAAQYKKARDCKKNKCIVEAILFFSQQAESGRAQEKAMALKMLIHLIADIHQPLHAGLYEDRGGNWFQVKYQSKPINLHKLWDHQLVKRFALSVSKGRDKVLKQKSAFTLGSPATWAQESHGLVLNMLYPEKEHKPLTSMYLQQADEVMEKQLKKAAWRLAMWLNRMW